MVISRIKIIRAPITREEIDRQLDEQYARMEFAEKYPRLSFLRDMFTEKAFWCQIGGGVIGILTFVAVVKLIQAI
jgi:hypothetical protein